jgi:hypothetical protein
VLRSKSHPHCKVNKTLGCFDHTLRGNNTILAFALPLLANGTHTLLPFRRAYKLGRLHTGQTFAPRRFQDGISTWGYIRKPTGTCEEQAEPRLPTPQRKRRTAPLPKRAPIGADHMHDYIQSNSPVELGRAGASNLRTVSDRTSPLGAAVQQLDAGICPREQSKGGRAGRQDPIRTVGIHIEKAERRTSHVGSELSSWWGEPNNRGDGLSIWWEEPKVRGAELFTW